MGALTTTSSAQVVQASDDFMPVFNLTTALARRNAMLGFVKEIMISGTDFGVIPGTPKPSLLKPGAEKLCSFFGLSPDFVLIDRTEDWTGASHNGEPFFYYLYKCTLSRNGRIIGSGDGSCNSWESKYRYRSKERECPKCGKAAIIKGKEQYGGGYICFAKKGGCGAKFRDDDPAITSQSSGKTANPDIADTVNTIQKMAQKRALIAATLIGVNASEYFTQDIEDLEVIEDHSAPEPEPKAAPKASTTVGKTVDLSKMHAELNAAKDVIGAEAFFRILGAERFEKVEEIKTREDGSRIYALFKHEMAAQAAQVQDAEVVNG